MTMQAEPAVSIVPHSLQAVLDKQAGKSCSFHVTIDVEVEVDWSIELVASVPQGINPLIKLLRFEVVRPPAAGGRLVARRTLRYTEAPPRCTYTEVWLGDGDRAISARVAILS